MPQLSALTLAEFVDAVGRDQPAPGCGGAAAVGLALAAACARKALAISARRHGGDAALEAAAERCRALAETAVAGVERDAVHFRALLRARPDDPRPAQALEQDAEVLTGLAEELRQLIERHAPAIDADLKGDAAAALALIEAFDKIERRNRAELSGVP